MAKTPEPPFTVVFAQEPFEIRDYGPMLVAETKVSGERDAAVNAGFRILASYIFGANTPGAKIAMTAPVTQAKGEAIAMTAPVTQEGSDASWRVRFIMPQTYTRATLPQPTDARIAIVELQARRMAVFRFSGLRTNANLAARQNELETFIKARKLTAIGAPVFAFYDPPWTLPFLRRNEILWQVA
jgi:hypothetical protein